MRVPRLCYAAINNIVPPSLVVSNFWSLASYIAMAIKQFYLLGEPSSSARDVEVDSSLDSEGLQHLIAGHFAIVEPTGEYFTQSLTSGY